jgi:hypothetical protein
MKKAKNLPFELQKRILVSFNHPVAIMLDGRAILTSCAICEEIFQAETKLVPKEQKPTAEEAINQAHSLTLDFPMFFRVLSLADGKPLQNPVDIMIKWNNISAICELKLQETT